MFLCSLKLSLLFHLIASPTLRNHSYINDLRKRRQIRNTYRYVSSAVCLRLYASYASTGSASAESNDFNSAFYVRAFTSAICFRLRRRVYHTFLRSSSFNNEKRWRQGQTHDSWLVVLLRKSVIKIKDEGRVKSRLAASCSASLHQSNPSLVVMVMFVCA